MNETNFEFLSVAGLLAWCDWGLNNSQFGTLMDSLGGIGVCKVAMSHGCTTSLCL